ncbi:MAG: hypothetical protein AB7G48_20760 [Nitrospiraceae bacterium]
MVAIVIRATGIWRSVATNLLVHVTARTLALLLSSSIEPLHAADSMPSSIPNPPDVAERNRVLEQEIRLAARPQTYLVLDLQTAQLLIKARGLDLYRLPISSWTTAEVVRSDGPFYLKTRPPITRTKSGPTDDLTAKPIELSDMPGTYELLFDPPLAVSVEASNHRSVWTRIRSQIVRWWRSLTQLIHAPSNTSQTPNELHPSMISLSLSEADAQSLAWTVTDGMPLLIVQAAHR